MDSRLRLVAGTLAVAVLALAQVGPAAAQPDGTLSPANPLVTYTHGPFTGANPTNNIQDEPDCELIPDTCDDFVIRLDIPAGYTAANPSHVIAVQVGWDPTNPANDFDVYFQDPITGVRVAEPAASSSNPEFGALPLADGVRDIRIRVVLFSVVNTSYTATITLGPPSGGTPRIGTYADGTDIWSCNYHLTGETASGNPPNTFDHGQDGEPSMRFAPTGKAYFTAIAGVPAGAGGWGTTDPCGQEVSFYGAPDYNVGGGDSDIETAPEPNLLGNHNVYLSSLTLANVTMSASFDNGATWTVTPISTPQPLDDREWNAAHGAGIVYLSYWVVATGVVQVVRLDYTAMAAPLIAGPFPLGNDALSFTRIGTISTDRRPVPPGTLPLMAGPDGQGNVYQAYINDGGRVMVAVSTNFGTTWVNHLAYDGGGASVDHVFAWTTVDTAGNVYVAFSDDSNIFYCVSQDRGDTWSVPVRVNRGGASRTSIFAQMAAGSAGRLIFAWYGHDLTGSQNANAQWKVFTSRTQNALAAVPHFEEQIVSDRDFHSGPICQSGTGCGCCREMLECFEIDVSPTEGSSAVVYGSFGGGGTWISRQIAGQSAIASVNVPDRSGTCPQIGDCIVEPPMESVCVLPGRTVADDGIGDVSTPGNDQQDIDHLWIAEPYLGGSEKLVVSMKVAGTLPPDPSQLPVNTLWTVLFSVPGAAFPYFVQMNTCDPLQIPTYAYGHVEGNIQMADGDADAGQYSADGVIQITISKHLVGNPAPGVTLTGVQGETRLLAGAACSGLIQTLDSTPTGTYVVRGNSYCIAPTVTCAADFENIPGDYPRNFVVQNPSSTSRSFNVTLEDTKGWIVGGNVNTVLGPVAPGGNATLSVIIRIPGGCIDAEVDLLSFHAEAEVPDEELFADCETEVTCNNETNSAPDVTVTEFGFALAGANPFRGETQLSYSLPERVPVRLDVYNVAGQRVGTLFQGVAGPGVFSSSVTSHGANGLGSGVYWVRLQAGKFEKTVRIVAID